MPRKKKVSLPAQGDAFAVPLNDGRYSVCRVLLDAGSEPAKQWKSECVLVACSAWIGSEIPNADDPALRPILHLTHHSWSGKREVLWISDSVPDGFIPIGSIPPTPEEKEIESASFGGWPSMAIQPLAQWRWDNDRSSVLAEDEIKEKEEVQKRQGTRQVRGEYLANITLEELRNRLFFPRWDEYPPKKAIRASRRIMSNTVQQLIDLGLAAPESDRMAILQDCIERFNAIDCEMEHFIETVEREDICEEFEAIVHACGLCAHVDLADQWRDW
ncbi:hypothetical protein [Rubinisphaera brasiliensis]|uniref:Uncharacterized protein n=1 Tax=Rubinisphaera brasiliensis (strain ATCC 49424 / DSM 5305 / JCM 21570 / IAM 15109 / NBRC 103401 / IFAM 1448) TaxID=756272 RepID=F0SGT2_RUBBR|nr:hypothetical protein [Rubinisphaera brasiliensis]ADY58367.1 hypothetical protein Plabr_0740 [Rubinisphaera brasiliensis DSM 5305]